MRRFALVLAAMASPVLACNVSLTLMPFQESLRREKKGDSLSKASGTNIDLTKRTEPFVVSQLDGKRLFFLFYNDARIDEAGPQFLVQRSKRTERNFRSESDTQPETNVEYMVEAFKLSNAHLKARDRHHGIFKLGKFHRREIEKELEIGCASIPPGVEGFAWPYAANKQYFQVQPYDAKVGIYDKVQFRGSKRWNLFASFDAKGTYAVRAEALGVSAP